MREIRGFVKESAVVLTIMSSLFFVQTVNAETKEEIQAQRSDVQSSIDEKEQEIEKIKEELIELNEQILRLDEAIEDNEQMIEETEGEITDVETEVSDLEAKIDKIEQSIEQRNEILKERISSLQENGGSSSYLEVLLGSTNFVDFVDRVALVHKITQADQDLLESQENDKLEVEKKKVELDNKLDELEDMKAEYEEMQNQILGQKDQNEDLKEELKEKEEENSEYLDDLKIEDEILANKEKAIKEAEEQQRAQEEAASSDGSNQSDDNAIEQYSSNSSTTVSTSGSTVDVVTSVGDKYIGNSVYVFGGGRSAYDIANGRFDCSGFVSWAFKQAGISLPASTSGLSSVGSKVSSSDMQPGDLVFFNTYKTNGHVGIYLGNNKFIGSQSSTGVAVADMSSGYWKSNFSGLVRRVGS
ncbi:N-terminal domain of peptidoglycan hydrolase CwlO-containing protein [Gracilibacillus orientalis]|uniref:N-terminal domain of peptidoglycan hydrolase CwlO-containing protein n=1 Tax=Gracilibacillus orientalis TaxID=334253 RepID=A0A1I4QJ13_9BACI|nr:C40 family peptidase [Gracilibacillus orientalis]SFM39660.1 N-terminal domain of peptidoglycan hydrolase CwlO-containing protein [Gracilibacillus orientalis]